MSYTAGTAGLGTLGIPDGPPRITCDGCGAEAVIRSPPPAWFLDGKAPRGWSMKRLTDGVREDRCPDCKRERLHRGEPGAE